MYFPELEHANGGLKRLRQLTDNLNRNDSVELHYSRLWRDSGLGIALVASDGVFMSLNDDYAKLLGVPAEMAVGNKWQDYTPEPYLSKDIALAKRCIEGDLDGYTLPKVYRRHRHQGFCIMRVSAIRDELSSFLYFFVTAQDIDHEQLLKHLKELNV